MSDIDFELIQCLLKDARMPFSSIAKKIGVSTDTVIRRYRKLEKEGVIQRSSIIVDVKKCGYKIWSDIYIEIMPGTNPDEVFERLIKIRNLFTVAKTVGNKDIVIFAPVLDVNDLAATIQEIGNIKEIKTIDVCVRPIMFSEVPVRRYYQTALLGTLEKSSE